MSEPATKKQRTAEGPRLTSHPASPQGLDALKQAWKRDQPMPVVKIKENGSATFDGDDWTTFPVVAGLQTAAVDLPPDTKHAVAGQQIEGTMYPFTSYKGDPNINPKGQMCIYPDGDTCDYLTRLKDAFVDAYIVATKEHGRLPGEHKAKHDKAVKSLIAKGGDVDDYIRTLFNSEDSGCLNWPLRQCDRLSTATKPMKKLCANLNLFRMIPGKSTVEVGDEFGPDVKQWVANHPGVSMNAPTPKDLAGDDISWKTLRGDKPDNVPIGWTGIIRAFGISAQKPMDGKIYFNCTFAKTWQISSLKSGSGGTDSATDMTRFFALEEAE